MFNPRRPAAPDTEDINDQGDPGVQAEAEVTALYRSNMPLTNTAVSISPPRGSIAENRVSSSTM
jgi:hypothetical protein